MSRVKITLSVVIFLLIFFIGRNSINAQTPTPTVAPTNVPTVQPTTRKPLIGISPIQVIANVQPGKTFIQSFTLENASDSYVRFRCSLGDYWYDKNNAPVLAPPGTLERSASPWIQFTPSEVIVAPKSTGVVKALITVPPTAAGGYYSMPFFEAEASEPPDLGKTTPGAVRAVSSVAVSIGGLFVLATEKNSDYKINILSGKVVPPTDSSELALSLDVVNQGNVHASMKGVFAILDKQGKLLGQGKLVDKTLLPSQSGTLKGTWAGVLPAGDYTVISTISFERAGLDAVSLVKEIPFTVPK